MCSRLILDDPALDGVAAVIFDEFHERSLDADFGLALALDAQAGLREDLRLLVMSATLDVARVAALMDGAAVIASEGRAFEVATRHLGRDPGERVDAAVTRAVLLALRQEHGGILVFLPGQGEISRVTALLEERLAARRAQVDILPLHGGLEPAEQDRALRPSPEGRRKVVLATSIAETSLTLADIRIVVDCGLARVPVYEPDVGLTRLETVRVSRASADQRRGRAGRTEPGVCYRLWEEPATLSLPAFAAPEILNADLSGLLLDCAAWGVDDPGRLAFLDPPPSGALAQARKLLVDLAALDGNGRLTEEGRAVRSLPLPPRLARMLIDAARLGAAQASAEVAAVIVERGLGGAAADLTERLQHFARDHAPRSRAMRSLACGWAKTARAALRDEASAPSVSGRAPQPASPGLLLALAYPERIAKARGKNGEYLLANGRAAGLDPADPLARAPFLAVGEIVGRAAAARIRLAAPIEQAEIETSFAAHIETRDSLAFDRIARAVRRRRQRLLGAILLDDAPPARSSGMTRRPWRSRMARQLWGSTSCPGARSCGVGRAE